MTGLRFEPVSRRTVAEEIREAIGIRIREGSLAPGSQLPSERDLCEQFGVARTSVREAMQGLVTLGVVERRGNRTYVVEHLPNVQLDGTDGVKRRVRPGMGRCQGGFCGPLVLQIIARETGKSLEQVEKNGTGGEILLGSIKEAGL